MVKFNVDWLGGELKEHDGLFPCQAIHNLRSGLIFCAPTEYDSIRFWVLPGGSAVEKNLVRVALDVATYRKGVCFTRKLSNKITALITRNGTINIINGDTGKQLGCMAEDNIVSLPAQIHLDLETVFQDNVLHDWQFRSKNGCWFVPERLKALDNMLEFTDRRKCPEYLALDAGSIDLIQLLTASDELNYWQHDGKLQYIEVSLCPPIVNDDEE